MFFSKRQLAISEMLRVLKPQGRLAVAVWDSTDRLPAYAVEVALIERIAGKQDANVLRAPFVLGDRQELATLFEKAGTVSVEITTQPGTARFPSIQMMVEADLRGWLPVLDVVLPEEQNQHILEEAEGDLKPINSPIMWGLPNFICINGLNSNSLACGKQVQVLKTPSLSPNRYISAISPNCIFHLAN